MSALQTRTNIAWLIVAGVITALAVLPGVAEARWRAVSAVTPPDAVAPTDKLPTPKLPLDVPDVKLSPPDACEAGGLRIGEVGEAQLTRATLCLLNRIRSRRGLPRLRMNDRLSLAAERHSRDMVRRRYFSHDSIGGMTFVDRIRRTGYLSSARAWSVAENLAWGSGTRGTPEQILDAWMRSPGHRANVLSARFHEVGIGVSEGAPVRVGSAAATYTTNFGFRS